MLPFESPYLPPITYREGAVLPNSQRGENTILHFGLYKDDRRAAQRRLVWRAAWATVEELSGVDDTNGVTVLAYEMVAAGFLSVWTAALYERIEVWSTVRELIENARAAHPSFFPGTAWELLWEAGPASTAAEVRPMSHAWSIREYDAERLGPMFGVSDDGRAAGEIVRAFLDSPKAVVLRKRGALSLETIGCCVDAERMSAAGELPVGIDEYDAVRRATADQVPMTTNVGTVVLPRFYRPWPWITVPTADDDALAKAKRDLAAAFEPYVATPAKEATPITVYVSMPRKIKAPDKVRVLEALRDEAATGVFADPACHRVGLLQRADDRDSPAPKFAIDTAAKAAVGEVMIEGDARFEAQDQLFFSGLLAYFPAPTVHEILAHGQARGVRVYPKNRIDVETAARTIWVGLSTARTMGAHLGKFGLFPLTLEDQLQAMPTIAGWFPSWSATPAFYVDRAIVWEQSVAEEQALVPFAVRWIEAASAAGLDVVLIDCPDRTPAPAGADTRPYNEDRGRRLLQRDGDELGVLSAADAATLQATANVCQPRVRILWAGGLDGEEAYDLVQGGAFGIFTTSTTARRVAIPPGTPGDPTQTIGLQPTYNGVLGVRMVLDAAFLATRTTKQIAGRIEKRLAPVLAALKAGDLTKADGSAEVPELAELRAVLEPAWDRHFDKVRVGV